MVKIGDNGVGEFGVQIGDAVLIWMVASSDLVAVAFVDVEGFVGGVGVVAAPED